MKKLIKLNTNFIIPIAYISIVSIFCIGILLIILRIQNQYEGELINLRFSFYDVGSFIESPNNVWQYLFYAVMFSILNGIAIWYIKKRFTKLEIQAIIVYWIFVSTILVLSLLVYYLLLVLDINNIVS